MSPALEALAALPGQLGKVDTIIADCGYYSETNVKDCEAKEIVPYIAIDRQSHNRRYGSDSENPSRCRTCRCSGENEASIENGCRQSSLCDTQEYCGAAFGVIKA